MKLADSRQGYGWISIAFHWIVAVLTFYLLYNGMTLSEGEGDRDGGRFAGLAGPATRNARQRLGDGAGQLGDGARQFGEGAANFGRQFVENIFAPRALHVSMGVIALALVVARIGWRLFQGPQPHGNDSRALNVLASLVQWGLLVALVVLMATGPLLVWGMGQSIQVFNWFAIPSPLPAMRQWHETIQSVHTISAYAIFPLVGLHILGALKHALIDRDGVFRRMLVPRRA